MGLQLEHDAQVPIQTHIDEFTSRASILIFLWLVFSFSWMIYVDSILELVLRTLEPCSSNCSNLYDPSKWSEIRWLTGALLGFITIIPLIIIQSWVFAKPGLMKKEANWLLTWLILGTIGFLANIILTIFVILPSLFKVGHSNQIELGLVAKYDVVTMLSLAIGIIWCELLIILGIMAMIIAGMNGLLHKDNSNWWRLRVHGVISMLILLSFYGQVSFSLFLMLFSFACIEVFTWPWTNSVAKMKLSTPEIFDQYGNIRKIILVQCECENSNVLPVDFKFSNAFQSFDSLCNNMNDKEDLYQLINTNKFTDVFIMGCNNVQKIIALENNLFIAGSTLRMELIEHKPKENVTSIQYLINTKLIFASIIDPWDQSQSITRIKNILNECKDNNLKIVISTNQIINNIEEMESNESIIYIQKEYLEDLISNMEKMCITYRLT